MAKGLCEPNKKGILKHYYLDTDSSPAIKRYAKDILKNRDFEIQYGNALHLRETLDIPLEEIIEIS